MNDFLILGYVLAIPLGLWMGYEAGRKNKFGFFLFCLIIFTLLTIGFKAGVIP
jgi:MFS-type transporter involved in bile tolerance (Atg22 family)